MTNNSKIGRIASLDPNQASDYRELVDLVSDEDAEVRCNAIERIGYNRSRETTDLLLAALDDSDELVIVQCLEELGYRRDLSAADARVIRPYLDHESELVRRYAASALAAARDLSVASLLKERLTSVSTAEQSSYCFALAALGERDYLERALGLLDADCYHTRCSVANQVLRFVDDSNREWIVAALGRTLEKETARAVSSTIERTLKEISESRRTE